MRKNLMGLIAALIAITVLFAGLAPANATSGTSVTVESVSYAETAAKAEVKSETRAVIDGATQVSWEVPNHNVTVTKKQLKKAVRIKVDATGANSSKVIFQMAVKKLMKTKKMSRSKAIKAAGIVVLKKGSCVRNTGRENRLRVGFVWCLAYDAVLVYDKKSSQYRHAYNIRDGRLIKTCLNYIGGNVPMRAKVVQVRYEQDVLMDVELESEVNVSATVKASLQCPTGTLYGEASASASGSASASIRVKMKEKVTVVEAKKIELLSAARINAKTAAKAAAMARVKLECGETPTPVTPKPDLIEIDTINDVLVNNSRTITVSGNTAPDHTGTLFCTARNGGSVTAGKQQSVSGSFTRQITYTAPSEVPGSNAEYNIAAGRDRVDCTITQDDGQKDEISTNQFEIRPAPVDPL